MSNIGLDLLVLFGLIFCNGLLAMAEIAVVSARKSRLLELAEEGDSTARAALNLAEAPNWFLSTVQVGITLVGICAGVFGGATLGDDLNRVFEQIALLAPYSEALSYGLVIVGVTYFSLVIGELVPKQLAINHSEAIAMRIARPMGKLSMMLSPAVWVLSKSTNFIIYMLRVKQVDSPPVTEEEIKILIEQGTEAGVFEEGEQSLVESVFRFADRRSDHLMIPRNEIYWLDVNDPLDANLDKIADSNYTRYPVCRGSLDNVVGIVPVKEIWKAVRLDLDVNLETLAKTPLYVVDHTSSLQLLERIKESGSHPALVIDEYGVIKGLVSLTDIVKAIVGEIPNEDEPLEMRAELQDDGSWLMDGLMSMDEFCEVMGVETLPEFDRNRYQTLAGFFVSHFDEIPTPGSEIVLEHLHFKVTHMEGKRIDEIQVIPLIVEEGSHDEQTKTSE